MDVQKKRVQLLIFAIGVAALSIAADKCRQLAGEEAASKSGQFTVLNCFDGGSGTMACVVKEGVKLYFYNIRSAHVERMRNKAIEKALVDALSQGLAAEDAAKQVQKEGQKAAKLATRQAKRIIGPIISSGWDFFEALYLGGTMTEGFLRGTGTLFGTYVVGYLGEERFGRFGYLLGSELGSWGECPVCKALVEEEKLVPLYGRGKNSTDPRSKSIPDMNIPNRPAGQRPETAPPPPDTNHFAPHGFGFMGGFAPMASARFGNFTLSAAFGGLIPSLFNLQVHGFPDPTMYGASPGFPYGFSHPFHGGHAHGFPQHTNQGQQADYYLKMLFLIVGVFVILALIWN